MNDIQDSPTPDVNGNGMVNTIVSDAETVPVIIENDDGPTIIEGEAVSVTDADLAEPDEASKKKVKEMASDIAEVMSDPETAVPDEVDPEFDRLQAITRFLVGGALEGTDEFTKRLQIWEEFLREEMPENEAKLTDATERELIRYAIVGFIFESGDTGRDLLGKLLKVPGGLAKTAVRPAKSVANSRLTGPIRRRLNRMADRGEEQLLRWVQRGYDEEPLSRNLARLGVQEITDEFINQLAQNEEVKELVQEQSIGLAEEAVEQVRERTFSADTLVERIARAVTRRGQRLEPPMADLSEYHDKLIDEENS